MKVRRGELGAPVDDHDDGVSFFERHLCLTENGRRDKTLIIGDNSPGINDAQALSPPLGFSVQPVASDAGFIANNSPPRADDTVKQRGFADVGTADDRDDGKMVAGRGSASWIGFWSKGSGQR